MYGAAKTFNEGLVRSFRAMHGLDYVLLRYFNVYGPRMDVHGLYTEVLVRWMERIADGLPPLIFGDGQQTMDFVYTTDIARANVLAAASDVARGHLQRGPRRGDEPARAGPDPAARDGLGPARRARPGPGRQRRHPAPRRHDGRASATSASSPRSGSRTDCGSSSTGGVPLRSEVGRRPGRWSDDTMTAMSRINVMQPWLGEEEVAAVAEVIRSGWVAQGPRVAEFESAFAASQQAAYAVAVSNCTTALHLALVVAGIGPGDDVVVPSFSFVATANAPVYVGARPVFADVDARHGQPHARHDRRGDHRAHTRGDRSGPGRRAARPGGRCARLCDPLGIVVIEDAACGAGSTAYGRPVGAGAEIAAWSFHPRKLLTTGEGGMLTTSRPEWAERARRLREHAMSVSAAERHASVLAPRREL